MGGIAVNRISKLQKIVLLSTTEAEYVVVTDANKEMMWCSLSWKNWVTSVSEVCYIVIVRVFDRMLFIMLGQSTYRFGITS